MALLQLFLAALVLSLATANPIQPEANATSDGCNTSEGPCWRRTIIVIFKETTPNQYLFLRGGAFLTGQSVPIRHRVRPSGTEATFYGETSVNDRVLDWHGGEAGQGWFQSHAPWGTPMMWTTNQSDYHSQVETAGAGFHPLNAIGSHYWLVDLDMDCSKLGAGGLFEFKGYLVNLYGGSHQWEQSNMERPKCGLDSTQSSAGNHVGRCGLLNAVQFDGHDCDVVTTIEE